MFFRSRLKAVVELHRKRMLRDVALPWDLSEPVKSLGNIDLLKKTIAEGLELWVPFFQEKGTKTL